MIEAYIETRSGIQFHFLDPKPEEILIEDIAFALANQCRYNGHCSRFYSVAEHSVLVASLLPDELKLAGLLHDASEAYLSDIPSPIKQFLPDYYKLEGTLMEAIAAKFGVSFDDPQIKQADRQQLTTEAYNLLPSRGEVWTLTEGIDFKEGRKPMCFPPQHAFGLFLNAFEHLTKKEEAPKLVLVK